jgi:hypothetical protein
LGRSTAFFSGGILLLFVLWATVRRKPGPLAAAATALFLLVRVAETPRLYPSFSAADFYPSLKEIDRLPREGEPFRIAGLGNALLPNQSALYGLEDVRGYEGVTNARLAETFPLWCTPQRLWFNRVDDPSLPFLASLNARFVLADPETPTPAGWREVSRGSALSIFENPAALPRAFAPAHVRFIGNPSRTVAEMKACRDFSQTAWIESAGETPREIENGRAAVRAREDGPDLVLDVDAAAPSWIVVSETNWKGWRASENNTRFPIFFANHAFVGFRVPAGRHRVRLEYRPASFFQGIALFATTLLTLIAIAARRARGIARRRESGPRGQFA